MSARKKLDVITAYREVGTYRGAAETCGVTHKTVKRIIEAEEVAAVRVARRRNYESVRALVTVKVEGTRGRMSAKRLLPDATASGYQGSARNFRRLVGSAKGYCAAGTTRLSGKAPTGQSTTAVEEWLRPLSSEESRGRHSTVLNVSIGVLAVVCGLGVRLLSSSYVLAVAVTLGVGFGAQALIKGLRRPPAPSVAVAKNLDVWSGGVPGPGFSWQARSVPARARRRCRPASTGPGPGGHHVQLLRYRDTSPS